VSLKRKLEELAVVAKILNEESDRLTAEFARLDEALTRLNIGLSVHVKLRQESVPSWPGATLSYGRVDGHWGLYLSAVGQRAWKVTDAPRVLRIAGAEALPEFFQTLSTALNKELQDVNAAVNKAHVLLGDLDATS
jgi:hypothetical protein